MFNTITEVIEDLKQGKMVIVVDDEDRENEGDFVMAADKADADAINFMTIHGRGLICAPITSARADELDLNLMVKSNDSLHETAFTVSIDSIRSGTGISAEARAITIKAIVDSETIPEEFVKPGHIFPLIAKEGGVLKRAGHTEAAVDLARLAKSHPSGVICEILNEDGTMARRDSLLKLAKKLNLKIVTIKDLIDYRCQKETSIVESSCIDFPSKYGDFKLHMFESLINPGEHHIAFVKGTIESEKPVLVRVHSECFTGDLFGSMRCDCGDQLSQAMKMIEHNGNGILLYMRQEGRGIGLPNKIKAYILQDQGYDTVCANQKLGFKADLREYGAGAQILSSLGVKKIKLMTNNPKKIIGLEGFGLDVVERIPVEIEANHVNHFYLKTKKDRMGHILTNLQ